MTQKVNPSPNRPADAFTTAGAIAYGGGTESGGYIVPSSEPTELSKQDTNVDETALNNFQESSSSSSLTISIDAGEAFIFGSWVVIDTSPARTFDLSASSTGQTVYLGWNRGSPDDVIIGLDSAFDNAADNTDQKIPLYDFDTDSSGVTGVTDRRQIGRSQSLSTLAVAEELGIPVYADSSTAPQSEGNIIAVDGSGSQTAGLYSHNGSAYSKAGKTEEAIEDIVSSLLTNGSNIGLSYDDAGNNLTVSLSNSPSVSSVTLSELMEMSSATEPSTPSGDDVALWNSGNKIEAKFSDGSTVTIAQQ